MDRNTPKEILYPAMCLLVTLLLHWATAGSIYPILCTENSCAVMDYGYYMAFEVASISQTEPRPYSLEGNRGFLKAVLGFESASGMPIGLFPTSIFLLAPFGWLFEVNQVLSYRAMVSLGIALTWLGFFTHLTERMHYWSRSRVALVTSGIVLVLLVTPAGREAATHGQTSMAALGLLLILAGRSVSRLLQVCILITLFCKPTYAVIGVVTAITLRRERILPVVCLSVLVLSLATLPLIGLQGWGDYIDSLRVFAGPVRPQYYEAVFLRDKSTTLHFVVSHFSNSLVTSKVMLVVRFLLLACIGIAFFTSKHWRIYLIAVTMVIVWGTPPYIGRYEDALLAGVPFLLSAGAPTITSDPKIVVGLLSLALLPVTLGGPTGVILACVGKIALIVFVALSARRARPDGVQKHSTVRVSVDS